MDEPRHCQSMSAQRHRLHPCTNDIHRQLRQDCTKEQVSKGRSLKVAPDHAHRHRPLRIRGAEHESGTGHRDSCDNRADVRILICDPTAPAAELNPPKPITRQIRPWLSLAKHLDKYHYPSLQFTIDMPHLHRHAIAQDCSMSTFLPRVSSYGPIVVARHS